MIFDEIQRAPDLLTYIKDAIDEDRAAKGRYVLTGSQDLLLLEAVSESLAGRAAVLELLPLSQRELADTPAAAFPWEHGWCPSPRPWLAPGQIWVSLIRGAYPELWAEPERDASLWHASYIQTYLERDIRCVRAVGDLSTFQRFMQLLAARSGQILNQTDLARDLGVAANTVKAWISVLEATRQITIIRPWFANVRKRLVKLPKVYWNDVGTLCHLVGLHAPEHAAQGPMAGAIFETAVFGELWRGLSARGLPPRIYFWRTSAGSEVGFLVDTGTAIVPIEVKAAATPNPRMARQVQVFKRDLGDRVAGGYVIHTGDVQLALGEGVTALPFGDL